MSSEYDIRMYGYEELYQKMEDMPEKINKIVDQALIKAAEPIRDEARRKARKSKKKVRESQK